MGIALAATAPLAQKKLCACYPEISQRLEPSQVKRWLSPNLFLVRIRHVRMKFLWKPKDQRANRDFDGERLTIAAVFVFALSMPTALRPYVRLIIKAGQIVGVNIGLENYAAPFAPVATIRPAPGHELLPTKTATTVAAITGLGVNANVIDEFHLVIKPHTVGTRK